MLCCSEGYFALGEFFLNSGQFQSHKVAVALTKDNNNKNRTAATQDSLGTFHDAK